MTPDYIGKFLAALDEPCECDGITLLRQCAECMSKLFTHADEDQIATLTKQRDEAIRSRDLAEQSREWWRERYSEQCALYHDAAKERDQALHNHADVTKRKTFNEAHQSKIIREIAAERDTLKRWLLAIVPHAVLTFGAEDYGVEWNDGRAEPIGTKLAREKDGLHEELVTVKAQLDAMTRSPDSILEAKRLRAALTRIRLRSEGIVPQIIDEALGVECAPLDPELVKAALRAISCAVCGGSGSQSCDDPQCADSTWDHPCNAGSCSTCKGTGKAAP